MSRKWTSMALLVVASCAPDVGADDPPGDPGAPKLSFRGFGTLGAAHSSEKQADFTSTSFKPNGTGFSHSWGVGVDSLLAGQVLANPTSKLSAIVQVVAEQKYDDTYWPHVEWANLKYQFTPDLSVRVGRTLLPTFMVTDSRKIGYANPWVRPPVEVYGLIPVTSNDGFDASYRLRVRSTTNTVQVSGGWTSFRFPQRSEPGSFGTAKARRLVSLLYSIERGPATAQFNYFRTHLTVPSFAPLFDGFRQFGPAGVAIADKYGVDDALGTVMGFGGSYDPGTWFVRAEWGRIHNRSAFGKGTGWYASGGYVVRKRFTPHVTYARVTSNSTTSDPGLDVSQLPPELAGAAMGLNAGLNALLARPVQETVSVGGRWDFRKNAALKLQLDHTLLGAGSAGTLANIQPAFQPGGTFNIFSATVDFVF